MSDYGLRAGTAEIRTAGPITFGPDGILFLANNPTATVFAVDVADTAAVRPRDLPGGPSTWRTSTSGSPPIWAASPRTS